MMKRNTLFVPLFFTTVFVVFYVFFYVIHPLIPYNTDDWGIILWRSALPELPHYNPTRVMPGLLFPISGYIAAYVVYPMTGDYIGSFTIVNAFVVSVAITVYAYFFYRLMCVRFKRGNAEAIMLTALFLLLHFVVYRIDKSSNLHLFYSNDVCQYYFYLIPHLAASCLVMSLMCKDWLTSNDFSPLKRGFLLLIVYLVLCSNLFCTITFTAYVFARLCVCWPCRKSDSVREYLKRNRWSVVVLLFWLFINVIEALGGRSVQLMQENAGTENVFTVLKAFVLSGISKWIVLIFGVAIVVELFHCIKNKCLNKFSAVILFSLVCVLCYDVLLCTQAGGRYITWARCNFPILFYVIVFIFAKINDILSRYPRFMVILPFLFVLTFSYANRQTSTFRDVGDYVHIRYGYDLSALRQINERNFNAIIEGSQQNKDSVFLRVPHIPDRPNNWPFMMKQHHYDRLVDMLHKHGLITRKPKGKIVIDENL